MSRRNREIDCDIKKYARLMLQAELATLPDEKSLSHIRLSDGFYHRIDALIRRSRFKAKIKHTMEYLTSTVVVIVLIAGLTHPQYIVQARDIIINWFQDHVMIRFAQSVRETNPDYYGEYDFGYVPKGYVLLQRECDGVIGGYVNYINPEEDTFVDLDYSYGYIETENNINNENCIISESIDGNGNTMYVFEYTDHSYIFLWYDTEKDVSFTLFGYGTYDELAQVKNGIYMK